MLLFTYFVHCPLPARRSRRAYAEDDRLADYAGRTVVVTGGDRNERQPVQPLPPIKRHRDIHLVCWVAVVPDVAEPLEAT